MSEYFDKLMNIKPLPFKKDALEGNVPIIQDEALKLILFLIKAKKINKVLELGTAVGYSAISISSETGAYVDSIEINKKMYDTAMINVKNTNLQDKIRLFNEDALEMDISKLNINEHNEKYGLIFIDAAKAQYQKFFEKYTPLLSENGIVVIDNLLFHGFVPEFVETHDVSGSRNLRGLARKIDRFNQWLISNKEYDSTFLDIGDGMALCIKKAGGN